VCVCMCVCACKVFVDSNVFYQRLSVCLHRMHGYPDVYTNVYTPQHKDTHMCSFMHMRPLQSSQCSPHFATERMGRFKTLHDKKVQYTCVIKHSCRTLVIPARKKGHAQHVYQALQQKQCILAAQRDTQTLVCVHISHTRMWAPRKAVNSNTFMS
jgi:hypothetical protein